MDVNLIAQIITIIIMVIIATWAGGRRLLEKIVEALHDMSDLSLAQQQFFTVAADALEDGRVTEQELRQILARGKNWLDRLKTLINLLSSREATGTTLTIQSDTRSKRTKSGAFTVTKMWLEEES